MNIHSTSIFGVGHNQKKVSGLLLRRFDRFPHEYKPSFVATVRDDVLQTETSQLIITDINNRAFPLDLKTYIVPGDTVNGGGIYLVVSNFVIYQQDHGWFLISREKFNCTKYDSTSGYLLEGECQRIVSGDQDILTHNLRAAALV